MWRYSSITKATYKGPQFVDSRGRVWVYNKFSYHYSSQGISAEGKNQVVVKGVEKRLKQLYPNLNLLFLDVDAGVSEVNYFNRMHFFVDNARRQGRGTNL